MALIDDTIKSVKVRRGGVILYVSSEEVEKYQNLGYDIYDDNGNIIKEGVLNDKATLQKALEEAKKEIATLNEVIKEQEEEIQSLKKTKSTSTTTRKRKE